jgi:poly-gamma-glutamate capsule biosynthesis protein CapA/YwtB (metallophosphatase superfamily)
VRLALAGDTMLGRGVADALESCAPEALVAPEVVAIAHEADLFLLNLECCISARGERWPDPRKPFFFRAPPRATELLAHLGVGCVTLANNHAIDFGEDALLDTLEHLADAGIRWVGAGATVEEARAAVALEAGDLTLTVVAATDHPRAYAAAPEAPGVAFADLSHGLPDWLRQAVAGERELVLEQHKVGPVVATVHWGPNMVAAPVPHVRAAAGELRAAGAALVAGHSAHVFHGAGDRILYDLGDFLDDYAVDRKLRNDLGLLFLVTISAGRAVRLEAVPLALDYCHTRLAEGEDAAWIRTRFTSASAALGSRVNEEEGRLVVEWE